MDEEITTIDNNIDINQALNEFQEKSKAEEAQKVVKIDTASEIPTMDRWVMKLSGGAIKEQKAAEWVLLGFVVVVIGISAYLVIGSIGNKHTLTQAQQAELLRMEQLQNTSGGSNPQ